MTASRSTPPDSRKRKAGSSLQHLTTEGSNPASEAIDTLSPPEMVRLINREDAGVAEAVGKEADVIARAVEIIADRLRRGGRLIYLGAGTSGRLGVLDAAECPPTFSAPPEQVVGLIAGGPSAMFRAAEGIEDYPQHGRTDLAELRLSPRDVVVGIATSGRTPYVVGGLEYAKSIGAAAIGLTCNETSELDSVANVIIRPIVGPEVISGSTRMKAGTATKLVLNTLTTGAMVLLGKTYGNLMVDLRATNTKLIDRSRRILVALTALADDEAEKLLAQCDGELKTAIVSCQRGVSPADARELLDAAGGHLRVALDNGPPR